MRERSFWEVLKGPPLSVNLNSSFFFPFSFSFYFMLFVSLFLFMYAFLCFLGVFILPLRSDTKGQFRKCDLTVRFMLFVSFVYLSFCLRFVFDTNLFRHINHDPNKHKARVCNKALEYPNNTFFKLTLYNGPLHPVSITRFPLIIFSPGAGLLRNILFHR